MNQEALTCPVCGGAWLSDWSRCEDCGLTDISLENWNRLSRMKAEYQPLRRALLEYGRHHGWCSFNQDMMTCSCGLDAAMVALGDQ